MKIAHVVCVFRPIKGGIGEVAFEYGKHLVQQGHQVSIYTPFYDGNIKQNEAIHGMRVYRLKAQIKYGYGAVMFGLFKRLHKYDVIHLHFPFFGTAEILSLLCLFGIFKKKVFVTYHMDVFGHGAMEKFISFYNKWLLKFLISRFKNVYVSSLDYAKHSNIKSLIDKNDFVKELPFGVSKIYKQKEVEDEIIEKFKIDTQKKNLLFVGGLDSAHYFKGVEILIRAMTHLPESYHLNIVGKGNLLEEYKKISSELNLSERISFLGFVSDSELVSIYNASSATILPSIDSSEAFGLVLIQSLACGVPIIASDLPGVRSVVGNGENARGLVTQPNSIQDLVEKIKNLLDNKDKYSQYKKNGLKAIEEKYNWEKIIKELENDYCA